MNPYKTLKKNKKLEFHLIIKLVKRCLDTQSDDWKALHGDTLNNGMLTIRFYDKSSQKIDLTMEEKKSKRIWNLYDYPGYGEQFEPYRDMLAMATRQPKPITKLAA